MIELEKKWLVDKESCPAFVPGYVNKDNIKRIVQGYLNTMEDEWIIRVRSIDNTLFILELKSKGLLIREELKFDISEFEFYDTLEKCIGVVKKTRYCWYSSNDYQHLFEVDVYDDHDFITCEVEFEDMKSANNFKVPSWCIKDVTYDPAYKNVNLIKKT